MDAGILESLLCSDAARPWSTAEIECEMEAGMHRMAWRGSSGPVSSIALMVSFGLSACSRSGRAQRIGLERLRPGCASGLSLSKGSVDAFASATAVPWALDGE